MQDGHNASTSFREIDEHGNAHPHDPAGTPEEETRKFRVNPFVVVLWVLNGALMVFVVWVISGSLEPGAFSTEPASGSVPVIFILMNVAPQLALLSGLATVALLFWHAWQWQRRRAR